MAYLNLDPNYFEHPKTKRLIGLVGKGAETYPLKLWCYCAKFHAEDGELHSYLPEEIESILDWSGEKHKLIDAMTKVGFLTKNNGNYAVNDWEDHEGHISILKERSRLANKVRWGRYRKTRTPTRTPKEPIKESSCSTIPTIPNHTKPTIPDLPYLKDIKFSETLEAFLEMRKKIKKPATNKAIELILKKLHEHDLLTAISMLEQSIINSWQGVFPIKNKSNLTPSQEYSARSMQRLNERLKKEGYKDEEK